jgi:hypothetical protein
MPQVFVFPERYFEIIVQYYFVKFMEGSLECVFIVRNYHLVVSKHKKIFIYIQFLAVIAIVLQHYQGTV